MTWVRSEPTHFPGLGRTHSLINFNDRLNLVSCLIIELKWVRGTPNTHLINSGRFLDQADTVYLILSLLAHLLADKSYLGCGLTPVASLFNHLSLLSVCAPAVAAASCLHPLPPPHSSTPAARTTIALVDSHLKS
jgi:hypothetical protein